MMFPMQRGRICKKQGRRRELLQKHQNLQQPLFVAGFRADVYSLSAACPANPPFSVQGSFSASHTNPPVKIRFNLILAEASLAGRSFLAFRTQPGTVFAPAGRKTSTMFCPLHGARAALRESSQAAYLRNEKHTGASPLCAYLVPSVFPPAPVRCLFAFRRWPGGSGRPCCPLQFRAFPPVPSPCFSGRVSNLCPAAHSNQLQIQPTIFSRIFRLAELCTAPPPVTCSISSSARAFMFFFFLFSSCAVRLVLSSAGASWLLAPVYTFLRRQAAVLSEFFSGFFASFLHPTGRTERRPRFCRAVEGNGAGISAFRRTACHTYHTGIWNRFSLSIPGAGQVQMMAPVPRFFSVTLSRTGKADASSALTFVPCLISIG